MTLKHRLSSRLSPWLSPTPCLSFPTLLLLSGTILGTEWPCEENRGREEEKEQIRSKEQVQGRQDAGWTGQTSRTGLALVAQEGAPTCAGGLAERGT